MYVHVYVYVYIYRPRGPFRGGIGTIGTYTQEEIYIHTLHKRAFIYKYICIYIYIYIYIYTYIFIYVCTDTHFYMHLHIHININVFKNESMEIYQNIHIKLFHIHV
jgi:hypothetical protein